MTNIQTETSSDIKVLSDDELSEVAGGYESLAQLIRNIKIWEAEHPPAAKGLGGVLSGMVGGHR